MNRFDYVRAGTVAEAVQAFGAGARFIAGGTNLIDLMKYEVEKPGRLIDITRLPLDQIEDHGNGLRLGALATNAKVAYDDRVTERYPLLRNAILAGASAQLRNAASTGGNLLQRTRCYYFYDVATPCNKREPGTGGSAMDGENRINAILGGSEHCIAVQPSDLPVALIAMDAEVLVLHADGADHWVPIENFHRLPGDTPDIETVLRPGDLIVALRLPQHAATRRSHYVKVRDRASFAWALASCAAALRQDADGTVEDVRLAAGGVATKPWRLPDAEQVLLGRRLDRDLIRRAAEAAATGAAPRALNAYKVPLLRQNVERALLELGDMA